jgi:hypothetical protein
METKALSPLKGKPLRNPGQSLDEQIQQLLDSRVIPAYWTAALFVVVALLEWVAAWRNVPRLPLLWTVIALCSIAYCVWSFRRIRKQTRALRLGRDGERMVGQQLDGLREAGARVFHDIPGEGFNLDHVVVSKHGIFVVETKTVSKPFAHAKVCVDGERILVAGRAMARNPVEQARAQVSWLARLLEESTGKKLPVRGAIVFPGWFVEPSADAKRLGVWVLEPKALPAFIRNEPVRLADEDVALAAYHISRHVLAE